MVCFVHVDSLSLSLSISLSLYLSISTSTSGPNMVCFVHVDFEAAASIPSTPAQARHQSQPSAISATPAPQSDDPCHQVPRLPRKVSISLGVDKLCVSKLCENKLCDDKLCDDKLCNDKLCVGKLCVSKL